MIAEEIQHIEMNPQIDANAKVWIYQSSRSFTDSEIEKLEALCDDFIQKWHAHGTDLRSYYQLFFKRFICLFVDESGYGASGCSIDSSVHFIQSLEKTFNVNLMNRTDVAYINQDRKIEVKSLQAFKKEIEADNVTGNTRVFNNTVATKGEMENNWLVPANESWHKRLL